MFHVFATLLNRFHRLKNSRILKAMRQFRFHHLCAKSYTSYIVLLILYSVCLMFIVTILDLFIETRTLPTIIVITPTRRRYEQLADLTRLSQTLRLVPKVDWIVVDDAVNKSEAVVSLLRRSGLPSTYLWIKTPKKQPGRGWLQRSYALSFVRKRYKDKISSSAVVYLCDDDNSYDVRLFTDYIRHVKTVGVWAVGLVGGALVEAPKVENGSVVGWQVVFSPDRKFAVDMAGFAVNLRLILNTNATFGSFCKWKPAPETCFIEQLGISKRDLQPFGYDSQKKEILVWHTKTSSAGTWGNSHGYIV